MNIKKLVFDMLVMGRFANIARGSKRGIEATEQKQTSRARRGHNGRKSYVSLGISAILLTFVPYIYSDDSSSSEQEALNQKIAEMETLITVMEAETDGWKLRSSMQEHAKIMEESARLASEMAKTANGDVDNCQELTGNSEEVIVCGDPDSIRNSQYRLLVVLLRHVIYRQNIIMEKVGIFR